MKTKYFLIILANLFLFSAHFIQPVFAHGDEPRIEISAVSLNPGSVLDIRGVDFELEEEVHLDLVGPQVTVDFGSVLTDIEGIFLVNVVLPSGLAEGSYVVRATLTDGHVVESVPITVWGTAIQEGGGQGLRDEDDGLLAPMPAIVSATPENPNVQAPVESPGSTDSFQPVIWIVAGIALVMILSLALLFLKKS